jgi:hypothetical protein
VDVLRVFPNLLKEPLNFVPVFNTPLVAPFSLDSDAVRASMPPAAFLEVA